MRKTLSILFGALVISTASFAFQTSAKTPATAAAPATTTAPVKKMKTVPQTDAQIADAKAKGMVWVNLGTGVYHKDGEFFGKTKRGSFMTEDDAKKAGHRAAKEPMAKKKSMGKMDKMDKMAPAATPTKK